MKFVFYQDQGRRRIGVRTGRGVTPTELRMEDLFGRDAQGGGVKRAAELLPGYSAGPVLAEEELTFAPCVSRHAKIICVGLNYRKHAEESGMPIPQYPVLFSKFGNSLCGHRDSVSLSPLAAQYDYEAELGVVIGARARGVTREEALDRVLGYCCANDLSARDLQMRTGQWLLGKTLDGFCPVGPYLVTADEVGDPNGLGVRCLVNGTVRQNSNTRDMIFSVREIVSYVSAYIPLEPGDLILTGTPEGVVLGLPEREREWLKPGDEVRVEIDGLGALQNRLVAGDRPIG